VVHRKVFFENYNRGRRHGIMHFDEGVGSCGDSRVPFFTAEITLSIPNVVSQLIISSPGRKP